MKKKILILCHDVIGKKMAGPGIRYQNIYNILSVSNEATLGFFSPDKESDGKQPTIKTSGDGFKPYFDKTDIIFAQWLSKEMIDYAIRQGKVLIFDMYAPVPIEYLASLEFANNINIAEKSEEFSVIVDMYNNFLRKGQFFTCSNERQRDYWIGYATANGILNPSSFTSADLMTRLSIAPMGIDSHLPKVKELLLRKSITGINEDDFILLWTGGIWDWFDARLIVKAMSKIKDKSIKLVFLGTKHPNAKIKEMNESTKTRELSKSLGLTDKTVFFMDDWIPYEERAAYFMDADAAIYADKESLETRFSHRTRVLDHFWTELPTICSSGDYLSDVIKNNNFGIVTEDRSVDSFVAAIEKLRQDDTLRTSIITSIHHKKDLFTWDNTLAPLSDFVDSINLKELSKSIKDSSVPMDTPPVRQKVSFMRRVKQAAKIILGRY